MYDHYFSNFGSSSVPKDICKDSAIRHARFWRRRFLKVFPIQMHREAICLFDLGLTSLSTFFSHIATVSGCDRELNAHF